MAGICDVPVISKVCEVAGEGAGTLVAAPFDWLASAIGKTASLMFTSVWQIFDSTMLVDITRPGYLRVYNLVFGIALFIMLIFFLLQLVTGLVRRDPSALARAAVGLAKSVLGSFLVVTATATLLEITDQIANGIVQATGTTMEQMGHRIGALVAGLGAAHLGAPGVGAIITIFLGSLAISGAALVWFSLLVRKALLLVAVVLAPVALAGGTWDATKGWFAKWASFVLALIFSKLVVVVVFLVAVNQVSAPIDAGLASIADPIAGIVLMFVAAFAPYMVYKFISFTGIDYWHAERSEKESKDALNRPVLQPGRRSKPGAAKVLGGPNGGPPGAATSPDGAKPPGGAAPSLNGTATGIGSSAGVTGPAAAAGPVAAGGAAATGAASAGSNTGTTVGQAAGSHAPDVPHPPPHGSDAAPQPKAPAPTAPNRPEPPAAGPPPSKPTELKIGDVR